MKHIDAGGCSPGVEVGEETSSAQPAGYVTLAEDGTDRLCRALYGRQPVPKDYLGGSNARMLHEAANHITRQQLELNLIKNALLSIAEPECFDVLALSDAAESFQNIAADALRKLRK